MLKTKLYKIKIFRADYENIVEKAMKSKYLMLIQKIETEEPFTALGFFAVDKTTLTSALATVVTYLIILIQFDLCE